MAIENPEVIKYSNEVTRVMAEKLRALKYEIDAHMLAWHGGIGAICTADMAGVVEDGRENEGVSRLTGNDLVGLAGQLEAIQTQLNATGVMQVISKPCVRSLRID
jgi:hypothetical protein